MKYTRSDLMDVGLAFMIAISNALIKNVSDNMMYYCVITSK